MRLVFAGRNSDLARLQVHLAADGLRRVRPDLEIRFQFRESLGDRNLSDPLWSMPDKGVFTEDFVEDLLAGSCHVAVHSWKDLPIGTRCETQIAATLPRADPRDLLLFRTERAPGVRATRRMLVLSSSPRRACNLEPFLLQAMPFELERVGFLPVRGNVPTRVKKLFEGDADALVVAKAAIDRLLASTAPELLITRHTLREALNRCYWMVLPLRENPTAPGQGALALEVAEDRQDLVEILDAVNDRETYRSVEEERSLLAGYGGGCHQKIGVTVLNRPYGRIMSLRGETESGSRLERYELHSTRPCLPRTSLARIWPLAPRSDAWFHREALPAAPVPPDAALWIAKGEALPRGCPVPPTQIVWASGPRTWSVLARRGVWVHGSAEGLGEDEVPNIETLVGGQLPWVKLTHEGGYDEGPYEIQPTYRLLPHDGFPRLEGKTHYFWASGSAFLRALDLYPEIRDGWHACGPGTTLRTIRKTLGEQARVRVALDHASWLAEVAEDPHSVTGPGA